MTWIYPTLSILSAASLAGAVWVHRHRKTRARLGTREDVQDRARRGGYRLMDTEELAAWHRENNHRLLLVDTRPQAGFQAGHITDAVSFPLAPTWWARWSCRQVLAAVLGPDKERSIVFYWDGPDWVRSDSAARVAVQLGYENVYRYPQGFPAWLEQGLPVIKPP